MRHIKACVRLGLVALAVAASAGAANGQETGKWFGKAVLVQVGTAKAINLEDKPNHLVLLAEFDGVVFNGDGKPFLDKARYQVVDMADGSSRSGYKTFTDADGSKVFAKWTLKEAKLPDLKGTFEFTGGTGKYAGITGQGEYHVGVINDSLLWDELRGEYKIPGGMASTPAPATTGTVPAK
jgi:hypothetical protein